MNLLVSSDVGQSLLWALLLIVSSGVIILMMAISSGIVL